MKLEFAEVEKSLNKLNKSTDKIVVKGVQGAAFKLIEDSKRVPPQAPFDEGHLWAQHIVDIPQFKINLISVRVGASTPYAARWHEATGNINWTTNKGSSNPGPKYILSKIMRFGKEYLRIQYEIIRKGIGELE
jgi:hypothetical protein